jgi:hypothetical protein
MDPSFRSFPRKRESSAVAGSRVRVADERIASQALRRWCARHNGTFWIKMIIVKTMIILSTLSTLFIFAQFLRFDYTRDPARHRLGRSFDPAYRICSEGAAGEQLGEKGFRFVERAVPGSPQRFIGKALDRAPKQCSAAEQVSAHPHSRDNKASLCAALPRRTAIAR